MQLKTLRASGGASRIAFVSAAVYIRRSQILINLVRLITTLIRHTCIGSDEKKKSLLFHSAVNPSRWTTDFYSIFTRCLWKLQNTINPTLPCMTSHFDFQTFVLYNPTRTKTSVRYSVSIPRNSDF